MAYRCDERSWLANVECAICGLKIDDKNRTYFDLDSVVGQTRIDMILQYFSVHISGGAICQQCDRSLLSVHRLITELKTKLSRNHKSVYPVSAPFPALPGGNPEVMESDVIPEQVRPQSVKIERVGEEVNHFDGNHNGVDTNRSMIMEFKPSPSILEGKDYPWLSSVSTERQQMNVIRFHSESQQMPYACLPTSPEQAAVVEPPQVNESEHDTESAGTDKEMQSSETLVSVADEKPEVRDLIRGQAVNTISKKCKLNKRLCGEGITWRIFHPDEKGIDPGAPEDFVEHGYAKRAACAQTTKRKELRLNETKSKQGLRVNQQGSSGALQESSSALHRSASAWQGSSRTQRSSVASLGSPGTRGSTGASQGSSGASPGSSTTSQFILLPPGTVLPNMTVNSGQIILTSGHPSVDGASAPLTPIVLTPAQVSMSVPNASPTAVRTPVKIMPKPGLVETRPEVKVDEGTFKCDLCSRSFHTRAGLAKHKGNRHDKNVPCEVCQKTFYFECHMKAHMVYHQATPTCKVCGETYSNLRQLYQHTFRKHRYRRKFECRFCGQSFKSQHNLDDHETVHTGKRNYCCDRCGRQFRRKYYFQIHYRQHTGYRPYVCDICGHTCVSISSLKAHRSYHLPEKERPHKCKECGRGFVKREQRVKHETLCGLRNPSFKCKVCGVSFVKEANRISHQASCRPSEKPYPCNICGCRFVDQESLRCHMTSCTQKDVLVHNQKTNCLIFKRVCISDQERTEHTSVAGVKQSGHVKMYKCTKCDESFKYALDRCAHFNSSHATPGVEPHVCKVCTPELINTSAVQSQPPKTYPCKLCSVQFELISQLTDHVKQNHTTSNKWKNPAVCEDCGLMLMHREIYAVHRRQHTGEQPFQCDVCNRYFARKVTLTQHRLSHFNQELRCPVCDNTSTFKSLKAMLKHFRYAHKGVSIAAVSSATFNARETTRRSDESHDGCDKKDASANYDGCNVSNLPKFSCLMCDNTFNSVKAMMKHCRYAHKGISLTTVSPSTLNALAATRGSDDVPGESACGKKGASTNYDDCNVLSSLVVEETK